MIEYRISKYDPKFRDETGAYQKNEWTSVSDIGKKFDDGMLEKEEYLRVENNYFEFVLELLEKLKISAVKLRKQEPKKQYAAQMVRVDDELFKQIFERNLREQFWCEFHAKGLYFWIGYEYYLHVNSNENLAKEIKETAAKHGLFVEEILV